MRITSPAWQLRAPCPCCGHAGLVFSICRACRRVVLVCGQVGTIFSDPRDLTRRGEQCTCGGEVFEEATSGQIQSLGFARDEYV